MADNHYRLENLQNKCRLCSSSAALVNIFDDRLEFKDNMAEVIEVTTGVTVCFSLSVIMKHFVFDISYRDCVLVDIAHMRISVLNRTIRY